METFTADYARTLVEQSKLKELGLVLQDIHKLAEAGASELSFHYPLKGNTVFELNQLGFSVENNENLCVIRW